MPGRQQICILSRCVRRPVRLSLHSCRTASQLLSGDPYDASKLVLDLDAADCKYVRKYESQQESEGSKPVPKCWSRLSPRTVHEQQSKEKARARYTKQLDPKKIPDKFRPSQIDFLVYALLDTGSTKKYSDQLWQVLSKCLPISGTFEDNIKLLTTYEFFPSQLAGKISNHDASGINGIKHILGAKPGIYDINRVTNLATKTVEGCLFVARNASLFLDYYRVQDTATVEDQIRKFENKLCYINAVVQRLETVGVELDPHWYWAGLYNSTRALKFQTMKKYIEIVAAKEHMETIASTEQASDQFAAFLRNLMKLLVELLSENTIKECSGHSDRAEFMKDDLLTLLTGWEKSGAPLHNEKRQPCFALLLKDDWIVYKWYIRALDKLDAHAALAYEVDHFDDNAKWRRNGAAGSLPSRSEVFSMLSVNKSAGDLQEQ